MAGACGIPNGRPLCSGEGGGGGGGSETVRNSLTGLTRLASGILSINAGDNTLIDIAAGTGQVVDNTSDPSSPALIEVSWEAFTALTDDFLLTDPTTNWFIDRAGDVQQATGFRTGTERRDLIHLGFSVHASMTTQQSVGNVGLVAGENAGMTFDMGAALGDINIFGNKYTANGVNLLMDKDAGEVFGGDTTIGPVSNPNYKTTAAETGITTYLYTFQPVVPGDPFDSVVEADLDPNFFDDGSGTLAAMSANKFQIQRIVFEPRTGLTILEYGQKQYNSLSEAIAGINENGITTNPNLRGLLLRGWVVMRAGTTDLTDASDAAFFENIPENPAGASSTTPAATVAGVIPEGLPYPDDIVFFVDPSNAASYPGSGSVVTDMAGNASNGTLDGATVVTNGSFIFDETAGKGVSFTKDAALDNVFDGGASVLQFVRLDANASSGRFLSTENNILTLGWGLLGAAAFFGTGNFPEFRRRSGGGTDGVWTGTTNALPKRSVTGGGDVYGSFGVTYDDSTLSNDPTLYANGQQSVSPAGTNPSALGSDSGTDLIIGNLGGGASNPDCDSRVTVIWGNGRILTPAEMLTAHNVFASALNQLGSSPGTATVEATGGDGAPNFIRTGGLGQSPGIPSGNGGCTDLGVYDAASRGFAGTGCENSAILSGFNNRYLNDSDRSVICGGNENTMTNALQCGIGAGDENQCGGTSVFIGAGLLNETGGVQQFIGAGRANNVGTFSGGGFNNAIAAGSFNAIGLDGNSDDNFIGAGISNAIARGSQNFIGGGEGNSISNFSNVNDHCTIGGGQSNKVGVVWGDNQSDHSTVSGGQGNEINGGHHSVIPGGEANDITNGGDYAYAAGRRSHITLPGAYLWSDSTDQDEVSNRDNQHKVVAVGGITERTTVGFGASGTDPGEAVERFNGHATTTDATQNDTVLGTLAANQQSMTFRVTVASSRDTGDNFKFTELIVFARRTSGTMSVSVTVDATVSTGTGSSLLHVVAANGDDIELQITAPVENWQHTFNWQRQKGGLTA